MKIAYMPDTHGGPYNQPEPSREVAARFCDQLMQEGVEAESRLRDILVRSAPV